jgi:hypothetical protein
MTATALHAGDEIPRTAAALMLFCDGMAMADVVMHLLTAVPLPGQDPDLPQRRPWEIFKIYLRRRA